MNQSCGSALPGDSLNTSTPPNPSQTVRHTHHLHHLHCVSSVSSLRLSLLCFQLEILNTNTLTDGDLVLTGAAGGGPALTQGSVFHFLSKLRRHASLEGAGPFYSVKKWSFDSVQRAASLDTRGVNILNL